MRVRLEDVSKKFGDVVAVEGASFDIEAGELFFLLGPSGCGKTTLLRLIAGFISPDRGRIMFGERLMNDMPPNRRNTGMVFQNYALWPHMTVRKNVEYGLRVRKVAAGERWKKVAQALSLVKDMLRLRKVPMEERRRKFSELLWLVRDAFRLGKIPAEERRKRVDEALSLVRMSGFGERYPGELSGGQQQRVAVARVLVIQPDILLLDEPLSNLDAKLRMEMRDEIKRIHNETGITFLYVTHDQKEALSMADRIALMNEGRIEQVGTPREIYSVPKSRFAATFLGRMNPIPGKVVQATPGGEVVVRTAVGEIRAGKPAEEFSAGDDVECLVRPEAMRIVSEEWAFASEDNVLRGIVVDHAYLGEIDEFLVQLVDGSRIRVYVAPSESQRVDRKKEIGVAFDPEDVLLCRPTSSLGAAAH